MCVVWAVGPVAQHNKVDTSVVNSDRGDHVKLWHLGGTVMREFVSVQRDLHFITASMNLTDLYYCIKMSYCNIGTSGKGISDLF